MAEGGAGGKEVGRISIRVLPNTDRFRADLQRQLDEIEKGTKFKVRIDPDMDGFRDKVDAATRNLKDAKVKVKTEFDHKGDLIHDLDNLSKDAKVKLKSDLDKSSLDKSIGEAKLAARAADVKIRVRTERGGGFAAGLFGDASRGASSGLGGAGLLTSQAGLIGVAIVGLLAPALALLSTALVSLPALVTAVALPIGVFALGLGGIKKALDDSGILTDTKGKGKNAKDKQSLGSALKDIQQQVSDVFEKGFTPIFRQMGEAIPQLLRGLPFVAQGIVSLARALTNAVVTPAFISNFDRFTNSVGTMLTRMGPGLQSFTGAMSNLITNVGDHLPGLGTVMSGWADRFSGWVTAISKPKQDWFKQDIPNSSTLDSAVTNLKPVFNSIINFVGQLTDAGLKLAANPDMANNIKTVIDGLTNFITTGLPKLNDVFKGIADTMHLLGIDNPPKPPGNDKPGQPGSSGTGNKPATSGVDPKNGGFTSDLAGLKAEFNAGKGPLGWLHDAQTGASQWLNRNFDPKLLFDNNPKDFPNQNKNLQLQGPAQQPPQPAPAPVLNTDGGAAGLGSKVTSQLQGVKAAVGPALAGIADGSDKVWDKLVEATKAAGAAIVSQVQSWVGQIQGALAGLGPAGEAAGQAIGTGMAAGIAASAPSAIAAATAMAQGVAAATRKALDSHSPSRVFYGIGQDTTQGYQDGLEGGYQGVLDSARSLAKQVSDAMGGANDTNTPGLPHSPWAYKQAPHIPGMGPQGGTDQIPSVDPGNLMPLDPGGVPIDSMPAGFRSKQFQDQIKDQLNAITVEEDQLRAQKDGTADKGQKKTIQGQIDQLNLAKDQLKVQATSLGYSQKYGDSQADSTKQQRAQLDLQEQQLKAQYDATTDPAKRRDLKSQMDQIKSQKDLLKLQGDGKDGANKTDQITQGLGQSVGKMVDIGKNFAMANVNQFENDIGISGHGAIPTIANIGLDWATSTLSNLASGLIGGAMGGGKGGNTHIHVNSIDEGLAAKQTLENRQALTNNAGR